LKWNYEAFDGSDFQCLKCGECCRAGYEVYIQSTDVKRWMNLGKEEFLKRIIINPECISVEKYYPYKVNEINIRNNKQNNSREHNTKKNELIDFITKNHSYYGQSPLRYHINTILPDVKQDPILIPNDFKTLLKGINLGLNYIIENDEYGNCAFLDLNECRIHDLKPIACKRFPFTKDKCLRKEELFTINCKGIKTIEE